MVTEGATQDKFKRELPAGVLVTVQPVLVFSVMCQSETLFDSNADDSRQRRWYEEDCSAEVPSEW